MIVLQEFKKMKMMNMSTGSMSGNNSDVVTEGNWSSLSHIEAETKWPPFCRRHFKYIFSNEYLWISIKISLNVVPNSPIDNKPALIQIMAWRRSGDKPLFEPMMA